MSLDRNFKENGNGLEFTYRWYEPLHKAGCVFFIIWDLLGFTLFHQELWKLINGELAFPMNIFAGTIFVMLLAMPTYWMLTILMNRTVIRLTPQQMAVWHGPLPWRYPCYNLALQDVRYICVEEADADSDDTGRDVMAMLRNGSQCKLIANMQVPEESELVRREANTWLRERYRAKVKDISNKADGGDTGAGKLAA